MHKITPILAALFLAVAGLMPVALAQQSDPGVAAAPAPEAEGAQAPPPDLSKDWPCVQAKVDQLSVAAIWDGPAIDEKADWQKDPEVSRLVQMLASRRVPVEKAEAELKAFAEKQPEASRDERLLLVFAGLFHTVNNERKIVINGIGRYQKAQRDRSAELEREGENISNLELKAASDEKAKAELEDAHERYDWTSRIFYQRQQNIPLACELPILMEERLYALTKSIRGLMKS
jgi:hypothetical protein